MLDRIRQLEHAARSLEPDAAARAATRDRVVQYGEAFLESLPHRAAYQATDDQGHGLLDAPIGEDPIDIDEVLYLLRRHVDRPGVNVGTPGYMAFIPVSGLYEGALGDYLAAITNRYAGIFFASPGAVHMERMLLHWMAGFLGYPESAAGDLTSGGSLANLAAVVTAREAHGLRAKDYPRAVVYQSAQAHHSMNRALRIAGLGECPVRRVALDDRHRVQPDSLADVIQRDEQAGLRPWLVVATAGTTDTGAVDPLPAIADISARHGLWLHVDGAYGAMFALCEPGSRVLEGIDRSDSVTLDPHKGLFIPVGSGAVLVRDGDKLRQALSGDASYLQDKDVLASPDEVSPADLSAELSRPFRGLRLWLPLKLAGVAPFRAALEEKMLLARHFHEEIQRLDGFEVGPAPDLSIVTFRYVPERGSANAFNRRLATAIQHDGRIFLSSTMIEDTITLRLAVLSFRTHLETIEMAIRVLRDTAREIAEK